MTNLFESQRKSCVGSQVFSAAIKVNKDGLRGTEKFQQDANWRDHLLFYEYFHGDKGAGLGASHQTGWTGLVASLIRLFGRIDAASILEIGRFAPF